MSTERRKEQGNFERKTKVAAKRLTSQWMFTLQQDDNPGNTTRATMERFICLSGAVKIQA